VFGTLTTLLAAPWLAMAAMGFAAALAGLGSWVLFRHPYVEIREISADGSRTRRWRLGVERHPSRSRPLRDSSSAGPGSPPPLAVAGDSTSATSASNRIPQQPP
jgi:hypothetical protein